MHIHWVPLVTSSVTTSTRLQAAIFPFRKKALLVDTNVKKSTVTTSTTYNEQIITDHVRSTTEGYVFTLSTMGGGGYPIWLMGGVPHPCPGGGGTPSMSRQGGVPHPCPGGGVVLHPCPGGGGTPSMSRWGGTPSMSRLGGVPHPAGRGGVPHPCPGGGVPQWGGTPVGGPPGVPPPWLGYPPPPSTCYGRGRYASCVHTGGLSCYELNYSLLAGPNQNQRNLVLQTRVVFCE